MSNDRERGLAWLADNLECDQRALHRIDRFVQALLLENTRQNLIAAASVDQVWWRHIVDSAQLFLVSRETPALSGPWLDLGSGAGFPGLIVAMLEPGRQIVLVEERRLRAEWLRRTAMQLDLANAVVMGVPLAKVPTQSAAVISARAFAPLGKLLQVSGRFSTPETLWLLPKGAKARQELAALPQQLRSMFHVKRSVTSQTAGIVVGRGRVSLATGAQVC